MPRPGANLKRRSSWRTGVNNIVKAGRLAPYILVSFLIHAGVLIGTHQFLKLPAEELETAELIPVEIVVMREESSVLEPLLAPSGRIWPKKNLQTKSRKRMETAADRSADDIATPVPKTDGFEPNVTIAGMAAPDFIAETLSGESADSKPIVPASQLLPSQVSPVTPSAPIETAPLEVKMPAVFVEAKANQTTADLPTPQRVAPPLAASRPHSEPNFDPPPLATERREEPRISVDMVPIRGFTSVARDGESVAGKPMTLASQILSSQVSPVNPSGPAESFQLAVKIPAVLVEAQAELTSADSQKPEKVATPLPGRRPAAEPVFEKPSLASERHDEPRLTLDTNPTLRDVPRVPETEAIAGKPVILASQLPPLQLSPADPTAPPTSSLLDVKMPAVSTEAKAATIPAYPRSPQKIETPLASRPRREDLAAEYKPAPRESTYQPVLMVSTLQLSSHPSGAQIYVDGMPSGETPLEMDLPIGKHEVRLALPEYYDWKAQIELTEKNQALPIFFRLLPVESTK
jgi:hypothetical protein